MHCCCLSLAHMIVLHALLPIPNHPRPYHKCFLALPSFVRKSPKVKRIANCRLGLVPFSRVMLLLISYKIVSFLPIFYPSRRILFLARSAKLCASSFRSIVQPRAFSPLEGIVFAIRRACAIEPNRLLDTIALILSWRCVVQAVFQDHVRQLDVVARCGCTALHCHRNVSLDSACEVAQEHIMNIEL